MNKNSVIVRAPNIRAGELPLQAVRTIWTKLKAWHAGRSKVDMLDKLTVADLKDIGLSPGDLLSIRLGALHDDDTRRQR